MSHPSQTLERLLERAKSSDRISVIRDLGLRSRIEYICRLRSNRAGTRLLMACMLAKIEQPQIDPRKPYTEIGDSDVFSGRTYDERYITHFINVNHLPLNPTTAFLTPALRNVDRILTPDIELVGRPRKLYKDTLQVLDDVYAGRVTAEDVLTEVIRVLLMLKEEQKARLDTLLAGLEQPEETLPLSSEETVTLIEQHLKCRNSSRLPVLVVAAAYNSISDKIKENALPLRSHNAADKQTGAFGDVEICLEDDNSVVTVYEMKMKLVSIDDIDRALEKISQAEHGIHNYIFITTDTIDQEVVEYASQAYEQTGGTEIAILDCIGFLRHFLHLFHRSRLDFLNQYQKLVLDEPSSAVNQPLKEAFLALRQAAETDR